MSTVLFVLWCLGFVMEIVYSIFYFLKLKIDQKILRTVAMAGFILMILSGIGIGFLNGTLSTLPNITF